MKHNYVQAARRTGHAQIKPDNISIANATLAQQLFCVSTETKPETPPARNDAKHTLCLQ